MPRPKNPNRITLRQKQILAWAIDEAETWRGTMVGNPDPEPLAEFDAMIEEAREALRTVGRMERTMKAAGLFN